MYKLDSRIRQSYLWNMIGSLCNAATTVILVLIVTRIKGNNGGGIISIAFATAQLMFTVGSFDVRSYQSTDVNNKFEFKDYYTFRIITCTIMMILSAIYIILKGYSGQKAAIVFLMCFYYMIDALADVFEGLFQVNDKIDMSGKSLAIRVILSTIAFSFILYFTGNLVLASIWYCIIAAMWFCIYDVRFANYFAKVRYSFDYKKIKQLLIECIPLFTSSIMLIYIINAPKYAIDRYMTLEMQNYFNILFMPTAVINLFSIFLFRPLLVTLAKSFTDNNKKKFISISCLLIGWVIFLSLCATFFAYLLGIPILSWIFNTDLSKYRSHLIILMIAGGASALNTVLYYILTIMRKLYNILFSYGIACIISLIITANFVKNYGLLGAAISYLAIMSILFIILLVFFVIIIKKSKKNK